MNKSDVISNLSAKFPGISQAATKKSVEMILGAIGDQLALNHRTEIRGFGSFSRKVRLPRTARNPKTGTKIQVPARIGLYFRPSRVTLKLLP